MITKKWRNTIRPVLAEVNEQNIGIAELLIQTYKDHIGKKKGELSESVERLEDSGYDYRFVRGLSTLLERRCQLEPKTTTNPIEARRLVFGIAHDEGLPTDSAEREAILRRAASELGITSNELEESLYSDLEDEFILTNFAPVDPRALVKQYNLSLTQTLLFYSTELTFTAVSNWQQIFRQIKWLGLIYTIWKDHKGTHVNVDGPASIFKLNRRYGTRLAKLVPSIVQTSKWSLEAKILRKRERHLLDMELDSQKHGQYMEALAGLEEKEIYDSEVEKDFATRFEALDTGWKLTREPEAIPVGKYVMIPDFQFKKSSSKVYLEVVGFWTPEYLEEKVKKLSFLGDIDMIIATDRRLACRKLERASKKLKVVYYDRKIPLRPILDYLGAKEERLINEQSRLIQVDDLVMQKSIVEVKELAESFGVLEDAIERVLEGKRFPGYSRLGDMFIREAKLEEIHEILEHHLGSGELNLDKASRIIEEAGGRRPAQILEALGYKIEWKGIDPKSARVQNIRHGT